MKIQSLSIAILMTALAGCSEPSSNETVKEVEIAVNKAQVTPEVKKAPEVKKERPNLFKAAAFRKRNSAYLNESNNTYKDADTANFATLKVGAYTSKKESALRVCANLKSDANPAISIRGKATNIRLTAMLTDNNTKVRLKNSGSEGRANLSNGTLCVTSPVLPAGSTLTVLAFPAISRNSVKYDKSAIGELQITNMTVSWVRG